MHHHEVGRPLGQVHGLILLPVTLPRSGSSLSHLHVNDRARARWLSVLPALLMDPPSASGGTYRLFSKDKRNAPREAIGVDPYGRTGQKTNRFLTVAPVRPSPLSLHLHSFAVAFGRRWTTSPRRKRKIEWAMWRRERKNRKKEMSSAEERKNKKKADDIMITAQYFLYFY